MGRCCSLHLTRHCKGPRGAVRGWVSCRVSQGHFEAAGDRTINPPVTDAPSQLSPQSSSKKDRKRKALDTSHWIRLKTTHFNSKRLTSHVSNDSRYKMQTLTLVSQSALKASMVSLSFPQVGGSFLSLWIQWMSGHICRAVMYQTCREISHLHCERRDATWCQTNAEDKVDTETCIKCFVCIGTFWVVGDFVQGVKVSQYSELKCSEAPSIETLGWTASPQLLLLSE